MNNLTLYNITNKFVELVDKAQEGELTEKEYNQLGEELAKELQSKSTSIIGFSKNVELMIEAMKSEEKRLNDNRKILENKLDKFKQYVKENMERLGIGKIETELGTLSVAKNPISVEIVDEGKLDMKYRQEVVTYKTDKKAIAEDFKATGEIPEGTVIHTNNTSLRIR